MPTISRRRLAGAAVLTGVLLLGSACGGSSSSATPATTTPKVIAVTFSGSDVTPNGSVVDVALGQPVELMVTADVAGEIHVHSTPEQELDYAAGTSTIDLTPITVPGTVTVESHALDKTIVQLRVQ